MKKQKVRFVNFKRQSDRTLSMRDILVLDFLWTWKAASTQMLKEVAYQDESYWWVYKALRRLKQEKYIQLLPRGKNLDQELWALTKYGFEIVLMDRDDMDQYRYRVHAPAHDYLGTCLQLGELWQSNVDVQFFTEQQISSLASWNFPEALKAASGHIPDGVTRIRGKIKNVLIGYEVDLNLKEEERYKNTISYYRDGLDPSLEVWLVRNIWMAEKIASLIGRYHFVARGEDVTKQYAFILLDDFKKNIWGAKAILGSLKGMSIRKLHANLVQAVCKYGAKLAQKPMQEIYFPKFKSPQKSIASGVSGSEKNSLTPFGLRGSDSTIIETIPTAPNITIVPTTCDPTSIKKEVINE